MLIILLPHSLELHPQDLGQLRIVVQCDGRLAHVTDERVREILLAEAVGLDIVLVQEEEQHVLGVVEYAFCLHDVEDLGAEGAEVELPQALGGKDSPESYLEDLVLVGIEDLHVVGLDRYPVSLDNVTEEGDLVSQSVRQSFPPKPNLLFRSFFPEGSVPDPTSHVRLYYSTTFHDGKCTARELLGVYEGCVGPTFFEKCMY